MVDNYNRVVLAVARIVVIDKEHQWDQCQQYHSAGQSTVDTMALAIIDINSFIADFD